MSKRKIIQIAAILIMAVLMFIYLKINLSSMKDAIKIKPHFLFSIVLLNVLNKLISGLKVKKVMRAFNVRLSFTEWFGASVVNNFYNYFGPKSGTLIVGVYFKKKHGLDYKKYLNTVMTTALITILTSGILGLAISIYAYGTGIVKNILFMLIFTGMIGSCSLLLLMPKIKVNNSKLAEKIDDFLKGWEILRRNKRMLIALSLMDASLILVLAMRYYLIFKMLSLDAGIIKCILISPFNIIMHFATIIPAGFGIKEATVGLVSKLTGIGFNPGLLATLSDRVVVIALSFITGPIFSLLLFKQILIPKKEVGQDAGS